MLHNQMSAIDSDLINPNSAVGGESSTGTEPLHVELLVMSQQTLSNLLLEGEVGVDVAALLPKGMPVDPQLSVVVMTTMAPGDWERDPPPVEERRTLTAVAGVSVLQDPDAFVASYVNPDHVKVVAQLEVGDGDITALAYDGVRLDSNLESSLASRVTVTGRVEEGLRLDNSLEVSTQVRTDQRTGGDTRTMRRSRGHWHTRAGSSWDKGPRVTVTDGFSHPPEVG